MLSAFVVGGTDNDTHPPCSRRCGAVLDTPGHDSESALRVFLLAIAAAVYPQ